MSLTKCSRLQKRPHFSLLLDTIGFISTGKELGPQQMIVN